MPTTSRQGRDRRALATVLAAGVVLAALAGVLAWSLGGRIAGPVGGPFRLVATDGRIVTDRDLRGRFALLYFGYASCPDVCPTTLTQVAGALDRLGARAGRVQPVFVTVDPARDTPALLRDYAHAIDPRLLALTGSDEAVAAALRSFHVQRSLHALPGHPGDYVVDHSAVLLLLGPDGRLVAPLHADAPADRLADELRRYVP